VRVTAAGKPSQVVIEQAVDLKAGTYYTVAAAGYLKNIRPKIFSSNGMNMAGMTGSMMDRSKASITVYHLSPNGPRVDALAWI
jgi:hypothetical protein